MAVDYLIDVDFATANTSSGNQAIPLADGRTPKCCIDLVSRATALDTVTNSALIGGGAYDGTHQYALSCMGENNVLAVNADSGTRIDNGACVNIPLATSEAKEARATGVSLGAGTLTINWASGEVPNSAYRLVIISFYGADMQAGVTHLKNSNSLNATVPNTDPGVTPDGLISLFNISGQVFAADSGFSGGCIGVGFAGRSSAGNACAAAVMEDDKSSSTSTGATVRDDACVSVLSSSAGTISEVTRAAVSSWDTTGFTVKSLIAGTGCDAIYVWFRIAGRRVYVGAPSLQAQTSGNSTETSPGFRGGFVMIGDGRVTTIDTQSSTQGNVTIGAANGTHQGCVAFHCLDAQSTSNSRSLTSNANFVDVVDGSGTSHDWTASLVTFTTNGFTYNVTDTAGLAHPTPLMFVEEAPQDVSPTGIASASAFGTPKVSMQVRPTGLASASAFGTPKISMQVRPTGLASASAFGTARVSMQVRPVGLASASAFGSPTVTSRATVAPTGIASTSAFGTPRIAVHLHPTGIASASAFGLPTVMSLATIAPTGLASASAFGTARVSMQVRPTGLASASAFGSPLVQTANGPQTIVAMSIASASAFGSPSLSMQVRPTSLASASAFGTPRIAVHLHPTGVASTSSFGSPSLSMQVRPTSLPSASAFGTPRIGLYLGPVGIGSTSSFGTPTIAVHVHPSGIASTSAFGSPTISTGAVTLLAVGIPSSSAFGVPTVLLSGSQVVLPVGLASASAFGFPVIRGGECPLTMKKRIHDALVDAAFRGDFVVATYPTVDEGAILQQGACVGPDSIECNEIRNAFALDLRKGFAQQQDNTQWLWMLILRFRTEVILEPFEQALLASPICVPRADNDPQSRQATLFLVDCDYKHPPRGNPSNGTEVRYRFKAVLSP